MSDITSSFPPTLLGMELRNVYCKHCACYIPLGVAGYHKDDCPLKSVTVTGIGVDSHGYLKVEFEKTKE